MTGHLPEVATDLRLHASLDWDRHQRWGSRSIVVWESTDLVSWGQGRLVEVAPPEAGNTWAPGRCGTPSRMPTSSIGPRPSTTTKSTRVTAEEYERLRTAWPARVTPR